MIRNYTRNTGKKTDFDVLSKLTSVASSYIPTGLETAAYDQSALDSVTNLASELTNAVEQASVATKSQAMAAAYASQNQANQASAAALKSAVNSNEKDSDNILTMILKIVPIGIKTIKKSKNIVDGFKDSIMGLVNLIKNVAIVTAIFTIDTIQFVSELLYYLFKLLICSVSNLGNLHKCILFYLFDVFLFVITVLIMSVLFIIDMIFMVKRLTGISCVEAFLLIPELISNLDAMIYKYISVHIFRYPAPIIKLCYTCDAMGDTSGFKRASSAMFNVVFRMFPKDIGGPIGDIFKGIGQIFSFFDFS